VAVVDIEPTLRGIANSLDMPFATTAPANAVEVVFHPSATTPGREVVADDDEKKTSKATTTPTSE
jgi:hypothetical protein